jgi:DMSO/TMAO reductase YedYZ molybdopterin-dependent catalytic subunit
MHPSTPRFAALAGIAAAAAGLGAGELLAALRPSWPSPVVAVADAVVAFAPPALVRFGIDTFGTADKPVLIATILLVLAVGAAVLGRLALRRIWVGVAGIAALGVLAGAAALRSPAVGVDGLVPVVGVAVVALGALLVLLAALGAARAPEGGVADADSVGNSGAGSDAPQLDRRRFLTLVSSVAAGAVATAVAGRTLLTTFDVAAARAALRLPAPSERLDLPIPDAARFTDDAIADLITPTERFYRIDINLAVPIVDPATHVLRVTGMVQRPLSIPFAELLRRPLVEIPMTMTCVSYELGGDLVGTAVWSGVRLRDLLDEAGVDPDADQIVGRSVDGYTGGFPVEAAYDRESLVVVGMNGEPLLPEHGFPVRLVTPGLYGYVGSTKWLAEIELTRFDRFDQYWVPRGYAAEAPVKTMARIDTPEPLASLTPGAVVLGGVAWAQTRGVERVEVQVDDGPWTRTELAQAVNDVTWVQWRLPVDLPPGRHQLRARATDGAGATQTSERTSVAPDGASGWHSIPVRVAEA